MSSDGDDGWTGPNIVLVVLMVIGDVMIFVTTATVLIMAVRGLPYYKFVPEQQQDDIEANKRSPSDATYVGRLRDSKVF